MCSATAPVPDYFALFGLAQTFTIDTSALDSAYRAIQRRVHPDKFAGSAAPEQRQAAQWAALVNEAYRTLKQPLQRARHLVQLRGIDLGQCAPPQEFLFTQLELREAAHNAKKARDTRALAELQQSLQRQYAELHARLSSQLDRKQDYALAGQTILILQFFGKLLSEIEDALFETEG